MHAPELDDLADTDDLTLGRTAAEVPLETVERGTPCVRKRNADARHRRDPPARRCAPQAGHERREGPPLIAAMAAGAAAAAAHMRRSTLPTSATRDGARRRDHQLDGGGVITGTLRGVQVVTRGPGGEQQRALRGVRQGRRLRPGTRRARGPPAAPAVRQADQRHLHLRLRIPLGRAARRDRPRQLHRHPDLRRCRRCRHRRGPYRRLRRMGQAAARRRHGDALRSRQHLAGQCRRAGDGRATRSPPSATAATPPDRTATSRCCSTAPIASTRCRGSRSAESASAPTPAELVTRPDPRKTPRTAVRRGNTHHPAGPQRPDAHAGDDTRTGIIRRAPTGRHSRHARPRRHHQHSSTRPSTPPG